VTTSLSIDGNRGCVGCHGRSEDAGHDLISEGIGAGLRQHHYNSGEKSCQICHTDSNPTNYTPVAEDVFPPFYTTDGLDPCNDILDNDGDNNTDGADFDCVLNTGFDITSDSSDNCPDKCNSHQLDADGDGIGEVCDDTPGCGGCGQPTCENEC
jgi:hypothetical protein